MIGALEHLTMSLAITEERERLALRKQPLAGARHGKPRTAMSQTPAQLCVKDAESIRTYSGPTVALFKMAPRPYGADPDLSLNESKGGFDLETAYCFAVTACAVLGCGSGHGAEPL